MLWYEPTTMIVGTALPDRDTSTVEDGVFVFGTNPTDTTVTLGSLVNNGSTVPSSGYDEPIDVADTTDYPDTIYEPDATILESNPLYPFVSWVSGQTGIPEIAIWRFGGMALILIAAALSMIAVPSHLFITGFSVMAVNGLLVGMHIYPWWTIFLGGAFFFWSLLSERSPSL
jgi:hypothetical protein